MSACSCRSRPPDCSTVVSRRSARCPATTAPPRSRRRSLRPACQRGRRRRGQRHGHPDDRTRVLLDLAGADLSTDGIEPQRHACRPDHRQPRDHPGQHRRVQLLHAERRASDRRHRRLVHRHRAGRSVATPRAADRRRRPAADTAVHVLSTVRADPCVGTRASRSATPSTSAATTPGALHDQRGRRASGGGNRAAARTRWRHHVHAHGGQPLVDQGPIARS